MVDFEVPGPRPKPERGACARRPSVEDKRLGASALHHQYVQNDLVGAGDEAEESTNAEVWVL